MKTIRERILLGILAFSTSMFSSVLILYSQSNMYNIIGSMQVIMGTIFAILSVIIAAIAFLGINKEKLQ